MANPIACDAGRIARQSDRSVRRYVDREVARITSKGSGRWDPLRAHEQKKSCAEADWHVGSSARRSAKGTTQVRCRIAAFGQQPAEPRADLAMARESAGRRSLAGIRAAWIRRSGTIHRPLRLSNLERKELRSARLHGLGYANPREQRWQYVLTDTTTGLFRDVRVEVQRDQAPPHEAADLRRPDIPDEARRPPAQRPLGPPEYRVTILRHHGFLKPWGTHTWRASLPPASVAILKHAHPPPTSTARNRRCRSSIGKAARRWPSNMPWKRRPEK